MNDFAIVVSAMKRGDSILWEVGGEDVCTKARASIGDNSFAAKLRVEKNPMVALDVLGAAMLAGKRVLVPDLEALFEMKIGEVIFSNILLVGMDLGRIRHFGTSAVIVAQPGFAVDAFVATLSDTDPSILRRFPVKVPVVR